MRDTSSSRRCEIAISPSRFVPLFVGMYGRIVTSSVLRTALAGEPVAPSTAGTAAFDQSSADPDQSILIDQDVVVFLLRAIRKYTFSCLTLRRWLMLCLCFQNKHIPGGTIHRDQSPSFVQVPAYGNRHVWPSRRSWVYHGSVRSIPYPDRAVCPSTGELLRVAWVGCQSPDTVAEMSLHHRAPMKICAVRIEHFVYLATLRRHQYLWGGPNDSSPQCW